MSTKPYFLRLVILKITKTELIKRLYRYQNHRDLGVGSFASKYPPRTP